MNQQSNMQTTFFQLLRLKIDPVALSFSIVLTEKEERRERKTSCSAFYDNAEDYRWATRRVYHIHMLFKHSIVYRFKLL